LTACLEYFIIYFAEPSKRSC